MMTTNRYDPVSQAFHWLTACAVIAAYTIALTRWGLPKGQFRTEALNMHMSVGMVVFVLTILRLSWRTHNPAPPTPVQPPFVQLAAKVVHLALYASMIAAPMVGLVSAWAKGRIVSFFWLVPLPSPIALDRAFGETLEHLHGFTAHALMVVAGMHAAAAIGHHLFLKDATLSRMLPIRLHARLQVRR